MTASSASDSNFQAFRRSNIVSLSGAANANLLFSQNTSSGSSLNSTPQGPISATNQLAAWLEQQLNEQQQKQRLQQLLELLQASQVSDSTTSPVLGHRGIIQQQPANDLTMSSYLPVGSNVPSAHVIQTPSNPLVLLLSALATSSALASSSSSGGASNFVSSQSPSSHLATLATAAAATGYNGGNGQYFSGMNNLNIADPYQQAAQTSQPQVHSLLQQQTLQQQIQNLQNQQNKQQLPQHVQRFPAHSTSPPTSISTGTVSSPFQLPFSSPNGSSTAQTALPQAVATKSMNTRQGSRPRRRYTEDLPDDEELEHQSPTTASSVRQRVSVKVQTSSPTTTMPRDPTIPTQPAQPLSPQTAASSSSPPVSDAPNGDKKKSRRIKSPHQLASLRAHFQKNRKPKKAEIRSLVPLTGLTYGEISRWFRNERHKEKKERVKQERESSSPDMGANSNPQSPNSSPLNPDGGGGDGEEGVEEVSDEESSGNKKKRRTGSNGRSTGKRKARSSVKSESSNPSSSSQPLKASSRARSSTSVVSTRKSRRLEESVQRKGVTSYAGGDSDGEEDGDAEGDAEGEDGDGDVDMSSETAVPLQTNEVSIPVKMEHPSSSESSLSTSSSLPPAADSATASLMNLVHAVNIVGDKYQPTARMVGLRSSWRAIFYTLQPLDQYYLLDSLMGILPSQQQQRLIQRYQTAQTSQAAPSSSSSVSTTSLSSSPTPATTTTSSPSSLLSSSTTASSSQPSNEQ